MGVLLADLIESVSLDEAGCVQHLLKDISRFAKVLRHLGTVILEFSVDGVSFVCGSV